MGIAEITSKVSSSTKERIQSPNSLSYATTAGCSVYIWSRTVIRKVTIL